MRKWIVTGGAGFIGANLIRALAERGIQSIAVDDLSRPTAEVNVDWLTAETADAFTLVRTDVRDRAAVERLLAAHSDIEAVLHLAGQVAVTTSVADPRADFETNALGTFNVLEATRLHAPHAVFINASTNKVYGQLAEHDIQELETRYVDVDFPDGIPESHPFDPHSPYGCSKAAAELYTLDYARIYGLRATSFRQSCIYGPRQFGVEDQGWVAWFALATRLGRQMTVFGTGKQVRDLLYIDDLVELYLRAVEHADVVAGRAFNVGGGPRNTLSLLELLSRLDKPEVSFAPAREGDQKVFVADVRLLREALAWTPSTPLDAGLERLLRWVDEEAVAVAPLVLSA